MDKAEIAWWAIIDKDKILSKKHVGKQNTSNLITSDHYAYSQLWPQMNDLNEQEYLCNINK